MPAYGVPIRKAMKYTKNILLYLTAVLPVILSGCEVIGGIFKAGVWVGILFVVFILFIIIMAVSWFGKKG